jgi:hypothetical protein
MTNLCECGCGGQTSGKPGRKPGKARFIVGHYSRIQRRPTLAERFWLRVEKSEGCWPWTGRRKQDDQYGMVYLPGGTKTKHKLASAHRVSWELHNGPIPPGLHVLHRCDNPPCVRPDHLFLGTNADNLADRNAKGRQARGERQASAKLTPEAVRHIRLWVASGETAYAIAKSYAVDPKTIKGIIRGRTWRHVA